jgi:uncharacterized protein (TIGR01777 family)
MPTVLIAGGTGLIGTALTGALTAKGYEIIILSRSRKQAPAKNISYATWDIQAQTIDEEAVGKADYLIHLAGENVGEGRWTDKRKKEIIDSRVQSTMLLARSLEKIPNRIRAFVSASAIGYYGPDPQIPNPRPFVETDPPAHDFLGTVAKKWEEAVHAVDSLGKRLVIFRTGIVWSREGGAYPEFKKPLRFGLAAVLGKGKQIMSWIHIHDLVRLYMEAIENENLKGVYNAVAPQPISNAELVRRMAEARGKFYIKANIPPFVLKTVLGEMSIEVLKSTTVSPAKIEKTGFLFSFPSAAEAIKNLS